ncbi:MAG: GTP cyclohydrolase II [Hyphomicrobiaceae bacterium]|nr:GTP cyclohydrolase II [Hyphomicrobiaceae bacterium]
MKSSAVKSFEVDIDWAAETILPMEFRGETYQLEARAYQGAIASEQAFVLINRGQGPDAATTPIVRVHSGCITGDIFHSLKCDCYPQLQAALEHVVNTPNGVLIYLPYHEGRGIGLVDKIRAYALQEQGVDTVDANIKVGAPIDAREYDLAAHILFDLGFQEIRLLTNNPAKMEALRALGIKVVERVEIITKPNKFNVRYIETKRQRMAHKF